MNNLQSTHKNKIIPGLAHPAEKKGFVISILMLGQNNPKLEFISDVNQ